MTGLTMMAQPEKSTKNFLAEKRTYKIYVNSNTEKERALDFHKMPEDVKIGWFAHELGHLSEYTQRGNTSLVFMGLNYLISKSFKRSVEHYADEITIARGAGRLLLSGSQMSFDHASEKARKRIFNIYYLPEELEPFILEYEKACSK